MMQRRKPFVFYSNHTEWLLTHLKAQLFSAQSSPFDRRLVIVPTRPVERWIRQNLADDPHLNIAAGVTCMRLREGVDFLTKSFFKRDCKPIPSYLQLALQTDVEIRKVLKDDLDSFWIPLKQYVQEHEKKIFPLAKQLALLFQKYSVYGTDVAKQWIKEPKTWQQALYSRVIANVQENLQLSLSVLPAFTIHLFGFSHLSRMHFNFFCQLAEIVPVYFYHLSPCQEFWTDVRSDKEVRRFFSVRDLKGDARARWEELLEDRNPLLANWGKTGRECALMYEENDLLSEESYRSPGEETSLQRLQSDFLYLRHSTHADPDDSIQVHVSASRLREIENLHNTLLLLISKHEFVPKDILVMAPDVSPYIPFIKGVFGQILPFRIEDAPSSEFNLHIKGLLQILSLNQSRWTVEALMDLFCHPLFSKKQGWNEETLRNFQHWFRKTGIRWGFDLSHRYHLMRTEQKFDTVERERGTWRQGIGTLFRALAEPQEGYPLIDFTDVEILSSLTILLEELHRDSDFFDDSTERSLNEWAGHLLAINKKYFSIQSDDWKDFVSLCDTLKNLGKGQKEAHFSFRTVFSLLNTVISEETSTINGSLLQAVTFCSMLPMRTIPAKVVCLIGMNEDVFPRKESMISLDMLRKEKEADYCPTRAEFDRTLFLEAIVSARSHLVISYLSHSPSDHSEMDPASVVQELIAYGVCDIDNVHPLENHDVSYFSKGKQKNFSQLDYRAAVASLQPTMASPPFFHRDPNENKPMTNHWIEISELQQWVRNPLKNYFKQQINLRFSVPSILHEEDEFIPPLFLFSYLQKESLKISSQEVIKKMEHAGKWPSGFFNTVAQHRFFEKRDALQKFLEQKQLTFSSNCCLELIPHQEVAEEVKKGMWRLPPLKMTMQEGKELFLIGKIEGVFPRIFIVPEKAEVRGVIKSWIPFLILLLHPSIPAEMRPDAIYFMRDDKIFVAKQFPCEALLKRLLSSFLESFTHPSFLFLDWIEALMASDLLKLEKKVEETLQFKAFSERFPELKWLIERSALPSCEEIMNKEHSHVNEIYGEVMRAWF